jgi:carbonic anhydrase
MLTYQSRVALTARQALARLVEGNLRFAAGQGRIGAPHRAWLAELVSGQHPFAVILGCSDSRVPPELLFDAGLGELFVVRLPGGILSDDALDSIQYATQHLGTPLVVVLGHDDCGAIKAALAIRREGARRWPDVPALFEAVMAQLPEPDHANPPDDELVWAVEAQVRSTVERLAAPGGRPLAREGRSLIVGAVYDLATGQVKVLEETEEPPDRTR